MQTKEEDEDVLDYHKACHQEEVIIRSHLGEEAKLEEIYTGFEDIKKENETEKVREKHNYLFFLQNLLHFMMFKCHNCSGYGNSQRGG